MAYLQEDGTLIIQAALDGGLGLCSKIESITEPPDARPFTKPLFPSPRRDIRPFNPPKYPLGLSNTGNTGTTLSAADRFKSATARQQMLQERLQQVQKQNPQFSFNQAWQHLQENSPELFDGMTVVAHPD